MISEQRVVLNPMYQEHLEEQSNHSWGEQEEQDLVVTIENVDTASKIEDITSSDNHVNTKAASETIAVTLERLPRCTEKGPEHLSFVTVRKK